MPIDVQLKLVYIARKLAEISRRHNCEYAESTCLPWVCIHSFGLRNIRPSKLSNSKHTGILSILFSCASLKHSKLTSFSACPKNYCLLHDVQNDEIGL